MRLNLSESFPKTIGRYELINRLAVGGMAELFLARPKSPVAQRKQVVIKRLLPHMAADPYFNAMFIDEAKLTTLLTHRNIAGCYELGRDGDLLYMVMEYIDGIDCLGLLRECARQKMRIPPPAAVYIAHEILDALHFAHSQLDEQGEPMGVVHRDISPSNVLLSRKGEVKLVDFGIARASSRQHKTKDGTLKGKYGYMSPEQVLEENIDCRSDIFSVGIVLAELLTGRRLFAARNELDVLLMVRDVQLTRLERYGQHIDPILHQILLKALNKQVEDRYQTAADFRSVLARWLKKCEPRVSRSSIAFVVDTLYDEIWSDKKKQEAEKSSKSAPGIPALRVATGDTGATPRPIAIDLSDAYPKIEMIDGIPSGHMDSRDSLPIVSIELAESGPYAVSGKVNAAPVGDGVVVAPSNPYAVSEKVNASHLSDGVVSPMESSDEWMSIELSDLMGMNSGPVAVAPEQTAVPTPIEEFELSDVHELFTFSSAPTPGRVEIAEYFAEEALDFDDSLVSMVEHRRTAPGRGEGQEQWPTANIADRPVRPPDDSGSFNQSPPIAVFYRLSIARASGLLEARFGAIQKAVYFREGIPEYVASNVSTELFGSYLVSNGVLTSGELSMALAMKSYYNGRLGDTMVALGLLEPLDVFRLLTKQVRERLIDLCAWTRGDFAWYGGRENPYDSFPLDLNAMEIIGTAAQDLPIQIVRDWLHTLHPRCYPRRTRNHRVNIEVFQWGEFLSQLYDSLDGEFYLAEVQEYYQEQGQLDLFIRALYLLTHTQMISVAS